VVVAVDADGQRQPLAAAYRTAALRRAMAGLGDGAGTAMRAVLAELVVHELAAPQLPPGALVDVDTPAALREARRLDRMTAPVTGTGPRPKEAAVLEEWTQALVAELGVELDVDTDLVLELARDAAHAVSRPAAPITTFLVAYAAAQRGGGVDAVAAAADTARLLATRWVPPAQP
jgi:hypothetical protein